MSPVHPLDASALYRPCPAVDLPFETTAELAGTTALIGQDRAVEAIGYAVDVEQDGHNLFVMGPPGTGKRSFVADFLARTAAARPAPTDWCYVNDFARPDKPRALALPAGAGPRFASDVDRFIDDAQAALGAAFSSEDYRNRRQAIEREFQDQQGHLMETMQNAARERGIRIMQTPGGLVFAPVVNGEVIGPAEFEKLPAAQQATIEAAVEAIGKLFQESMRDLPERLRASRARIRELDRELAEFAIQRLCAELIQRYRLLPDARGYLEAMRADLIDHYEMLRGVEPGPQQPFRLDLDGEESPDAKAHRRYGVNVLVTRDPHGGAPVVVEDRPAYGRLLGKIEHRARFGALLTDLRLIRAGALHEANGGYLVLHAQRLLSEPFAWDALKECLRKRVIRIVPLDQVYGLMSAASLEPAPIPLTLKVVLIGSPQLYYLLRALDPEFEDYFKVVAEFDDRSPRRDDTHRRFAERLAGQAQADQLLPLHRDAVARIIEESARDAEDAERLSSEIRRSIDLLRAAHHWAQKRKASAIGVEDVEHAIERDAYRKGRLRERVQEEILRDTMLIATSGTQTGQVNGLAVLQVGDQPFGRPSRITARVSLGSGDIIDIEREAELGGALHSKGVMILGGYIAARYAIEAPASFSATLAFEQSYGGIDGDSASSTELYALISALAELPLRQDLAVTGSVNQFGEVQAIGGVNHKIEGFFDICAARGLTGTQGVLIPAANVRHLMLRAPVREACAAGRFHIYPIRHIDEGLELLTGLPAGGGPVEAETVDAYVLQRLASFAALRQRFNAGPGPRDGQP